MSKVFKVHQCIEVEPCRVELLDPVAFLIKEEPVAEEENADEPSTVETVPDLPSEAELRAAAQLALEQAEAEAQILIGQGKREQARLVAEARQQAERIKTEARQAGVAEGRATGLAEIKQELAGYLTQALDRLAEADALREQRIWASEPELLKLAVGIAAQLIHAELELKPKKQLTILKQALARIPGAAGYKIRLHPADLENLAEVAPQLQTVFNEPKQLELVPDPAVEPGGCFIVTELGNIDARMATQLELTLSELLKVGQMQ